VLINPKDLGNPESIVAAPKIASVTVKSSAQKPGGQLKKRVRKGQHISAKRAVVVSEELPVISSFPTIGEEVPLLPRIESEVRDFRHVNTERAFIN
jgi:hypothetical protein